MAHTFPDNELRVLDGSQLSKELVLDCLEHQMDWTDSRDESNMPKEEFEVIEMSDTREVRDEPMLEEEHLGERGWQEMSSELDYLQL